MLLVIGHWSKIVQRLLYDYKNLLRVDVVDQFLQLLWEESPWGLNLWRHVKVVPWLVWDKSISDTQFLSNRAGCAAQ